MSYYDSLSTLKASDNLKRKTLEAMNRKRDKIMSVKFKSLRIIIVTACILCLSTITVFAVSRLLTPKEIAGILENPAVSAAFDSKDAIIVNKSITEFGYTVTFLGIASGNDLGELTDTKDKSYAVVAIENADGTPMDDNAYTEPFLVSPLIKGLNPALYNAVTMNGGFSERIIDGIRYRLAECDSIEMFADRGLYLAVTATTFYDNTAFLVDETTGEITPNPDYGVFNALFSLPIDTTKANRVKADEYIASVMAPTQDTPEPEDESGNPPMHKFLDSVEEILEKATPIEASRQIIKPDAKNEFPYSYSTENDGSTTTTIGEFRLKAQKPNAPFLHSASGSGDENAITEQYLICTLLDDGTLEAVLYEIKA